MPQCVADGCVAQTKIHSLCAAAVGERGGVGEYVATSFCFSPARDKMLRRGILATEVSNGPLLPVVRFVRDHSTSLVEKLMEMVNIRESLGVAWLCKWDHRSWARCFSWHGWLLGSGFSSGC